MHHSKWMHIKLVEFVLSLVYVFSHCMRGDR